MLIQYPSVLDINTHLQSPISDTQQIVDEFNGREFGWDVGWGAWGLSVIYADMGGWDEESEKTFANALRFLLHRLKVSGNYTDIPIGNGRGGGLFPTYKTNRGLLTISAVEFDPTQDKRIYTLSTDVTELVEGMWLSVNYLGHPRLLQVWEKLTNVNSKTRIVTRPSLPLITGTTLARATSMRVRVPDKAGLGLDFGRIDQGKRGVTYPGAEIQYVEYNSWR